MLAKGRVAANAAAYTGSVTAKAFLEALKAVQGRVEDREALIKAWDQVSFNGPAGPFRSTKTTTSSATWTAARDATKAAGYPVFVYAAFVLGGCLEQ